MRNSFLFVAFLVVLLSCQYMDKKSNPSRLTNFKAISEIKMQEKSYKFNLDSCTSVLENKTLTLLFNNKSVTSSPYELKIESAGNKFVTNCSMTYLLTDSSFRPVILKEISQNISLDTKYFEKGDIITGNIDLSFSAFHSWDTVYTDTVKIWGKFVTLIN